MTGASRRAIRISKASAQIQKAAQESSLAERELFNHLKLLTDSPSASAEAIDLHLSANCDEEARRAIIGQFLVRALYSDRPDQLLVWSIVAAMPEPCRLPDHLRRALKNFAEKH